MAIDTEAKRRSVAELHPTGHILPKPDGTISAADRRVVAGVYGGGAVSSSSVNRNVMYNEYNGLYDPIYLVNDLYNSGRNVLETVNEQYG